MICPWCSWVGKTADPPRCPDCGCESCREGPETRAAYDVLLTERLAYMLDICARLNRDKPEGETDGTQILR